MMVMMLMLLLLLLTAGSWSGRLWSAPEAAGARSCHCGRRLLTRTAAPKEEPLSGYADGRPFSIKHTMTVARGAKDFVVSALARFRFACGSDVGW